MPLQLVLAGFVLFGSTFSFGATLQNITNLDQIPVEDIEVLNEVMKDTHSNTVNFLYTRKNPLKPQLLLINNESSIRESNYVKGVTTYYIVHGFVHDSNSTINIRIKDALLNYSDANVIVFGWSKLANIDYNASVIGVPIVGKALGEFIQYLQSVTGTPLSNFYLIGHSLGAHLVGNAGRALNGQVGRITALDPAGPGWYSKPNAITKSDAQYVEAIHTGARFYGMTTAVGHTDFYVNGGMYQPDCIDDSCSHQAAWKLFEVSVSHTFVGYKCFYRIQALYGVCFGRKLDMGDADVRKRGSGIYRVNTKSQFPYY